MKMIKYKELDEKAWLDFGKKLLNKDEPEKQEEFLEACKDKQSFLDYLNENLPEENSIVDGETMNFSHQFTEGEFCGPTRHTQEIIWNQFKDLPHETKMHCGFWGYIIINLIKLDCIEPSYLAACNGNSKGVPSDGAKGLFQLDHILNESDQEETDEVKGTNDNENDKAIIRLKKIDTGVRRILRSMCNPVPRGKRIVFNDFPIGKSYWHWRWSEQMSQFDDLSLSAEEIRKLLDSKSYGTFSEKMHSGKSYISQRNLLGGLLLFLKEEEEKKEKEEKKKSVHLGKVIDRLSYLSVWKGIELQSPEANKEEIRKIYVSLEKATTQEKAESS